MGPGQRIRERLLRVRIKTKLMVMFIALIIISVAAVSVTVYQNTTRILERRAEQTTERSINQASSFLSYKLSNVKDISSILFMNKELNQILNKGRSELPMGEQIDDYRRIISILRSAQNSRDIYSIRLYVDSAGIYARENSIIFALSTIQDAHWYGEMLRNGEGIYCRSTYKYDYYGERGEQNIVSCVRPLYSDGFTGGVVGVVSIDILENTFQQIIKETEITSTGRVYLVDARDRVVSGMDDGDLGNVIPTVDAKSHIVINQQIEGASWRLVAYIPKREVNAEISQWTSRLYAVLFAVIVFGAIFAVVFSEGITRRIQPLLQHIKQIEAENWDAHTPVTAHDEIGVLQSHMNRMSDNMRRLIRDKYKTETRKKAAELQALQAQINPHFLYNTLDLIHWMAMERGAVEISDVAGQLSTFFRISLSGGRDVITIEDEIAHARTYLDIQNRRFGGRIRYTIDADPELLQLKTVKLVLQPVVENAILHGIRERRGSEGDIRIGCRLEGGCLELAVEDNGIGMSDEQLARLNGDGSAAGYGIRNVKDKLRLYFGGEACVVFERRQGEGTIVRLRFPATPVDIRPNEEMEEQTDSDNKGSDS
ncbi:sensor histidine kinase [uncultured Paenibacillus sp.]|uniref:cache domain-containing sensor histidine kinase n=1 Tax=uncultured Paenibacillus sp. TaxID=227322 RepID=UPI0028D8636B|nr:sensor histidine kinase [uncultured Paenibacillus sp.]